MKISESLEQVKRETNTSMKLSIIAEDKERYEGYSEVLELIEKALAIVDEKGLV